MRLARLVGNPYDIAADEPHFGVEIEVENSIRPSYVSRLVRSSGWTTTGDGSLRNAGIEFLSDGPRRWKDVEEDVRRFYAVKDAAQWATGVRTSTHVHVNVLGHTMDEIMAAAIVYTLMEPLLFRYCGPLREENIYCVPWYRARTELDLMRQVLNGRTISGLTIACKYSAMYLEPVVRFGTMEFRQAPVFDKVEQLLDWIKICERVVYSGFKSAEEVLECFGELTVDEFVEGLVGSDLARVLREACETDFETLLEQYDVETSAEIPLACTYKPNAWLTVDIGAEGDGTTNYHYNRPVGVPAYARYEPDFFREEEPEEYYDDEEDY